MRAEVLEIDLRTRLVDTSAGPIRPDILVIALGTAPDFLGIPGADTNSLTLKSVRDAVHLRDTLLDLRSRRPVTRVVIVGAGYTGSEVAGELSAADYRVPDVGDLGWIDVRIVAEDTRLLPQASPRVSAAVERILRARHVPLHLGRSVRGVDEVGVHSESGTLFEAELVVWAGQTQVAIDVEAATGHEIEGGKFVVDPYLRVGGQDTIFACGDASVAFDYVAGRVAASSAQLALQAGDVVARNIDAMVRGKEPREYRPRVVGEALSLGDTAAVAEVGGVLLSGRAAASVKRAALLRYLAGLTFPAIA
jgi:NADH dehydrogenase